MRLPALPLLAAALAAVPAPAADAQTLPQTVLYGSGTDAGDKFGYSVDVHGDVLLVGAPNDRHPDTPGAWLVGRVYVFNRDRLAGGWTETELLSPVTTGGDSGGGGGFGDVVDLSPDGRTAVVGAPGTTFGSGGPSNINSHGAAYLFRYDTTAQRWGREALLRDPTSVSYTRAGDYVSTSNDLVAMNGRSGSLIVFRYTPNVDDGGDGPGGYAFGPWTLEWRFTSESATSGMHYVAVAGDPVEGERVAGTSFEPNAAGGTGILYIWRNDGREGDPALWTREARMQPPSGSPGRSYFGEPVLSADGRLLFASVAVIEEFSRSSAVHVYRRIGSGAASQWTLESVLTSPVPIVNAYFTSAAHWTDPATGDVLVASSTNGSYTDLYRRRGGRWSHVTTVQTLVVGMLSGRTLAGGNWRDATRGENAGQASVLELPQAVPDEAGPDAPAAALSVLVSPNPSRGAAEARVVLAAASASVRVVVYDVLGRSVAVLHEGALGVGTHRLPVGGLGPGVYVVRASAAGGGGSGALASSSRLVVAAR